MMRNLLNQGYIYTRIHRFASRHQSSLPKRQKNLVFPCSDPLKRPTTQFTIDLAMSPYERSKYLGGAWKIENPHQQNQENWDKADLFERERIALKSTYNKKLKEYQFNGNHTAAHEIFLNMIEDGIEPDGTTYRHLFQSANAYSSGESRDRNMDDVIYYFETGRALGFQFTQEMYSRLIGAFARQNHMLYWPMINRFYNDMIRNGLKPDTYIFVHIINVVSRRQGIYECKDYLLQCQEVLGEIPVIVWRSLCNVVRKSRTQMMSRNLLDVILSIKLNDEEKTKALNSVISRCQNYSGGNKKWTTNVDELGILDRHEQCANEGFKIWERGLIEGIKVNADSFMLLTKTVLDYAKNPCVDHKCELYRQILDKFYALQNQRREKMCLLDFKSLQDVCYVASQDQNIQQTSAALYELQNYYNDESDRSVQVLKRGEVSQKQYNEPYFETKTGSLVDSLHKAFLRWETSKLLTKENLRKVIPLNLRKALRVYLKDIKHKV